MICIIDVSDELLGTTTAFRFCCTPCIILFLLFCHSIARSLLLALWSFTSHRRIDLGTAPTLTSHHSIRRSLCYSRAQLGSSCQITDGKREKFGQKLTLESGVPWDQRGSLGGTPWQDVTLINHFL